MSATRTRVIFAFVIFLASSVPFLVQAQTQSSQELLAKIQSLQAQLAGLSGSSMFCDLPTHTMRRGASGDEVSRLQQFLARDVSIYPEGAVTGYYGALTEMAVQRWQIKNGIVSGGTAGTTGFGAVGPRTLAAMRAVWCLQSNTTASPFILKDLPASVGAATQTVPGASTTASIQAAAQIGFTMPLASTTARKGSIVIASWKSVNAPLGASVTISLATPTGSSLGILKSSLTSSGSYYWTIPAAANTTTNFGTCSGSAIDCLTQLAGSTNDCGTLCSLSDGLYVLYAQLVSGAKELAHAKSVPFLITGSDTSSAGTNFGSTGSTSYSSTFGQTTSWTSTDFSSQAQSCIYSGVPYTDGISLEINCADVKAVGQSCGAFGGLRLTCRNGVWVDDKGVAQSVRNVTTTNTAGSCTTPWGSMIVANGNEVPYEPFFSSGQYSGAFMLKLMRCSSGTWQTCDTVGDNCH